MAGLVLTTQARAEKLLPDIDNLYWFTENQNQYLGSMDDYIYEEPMAEETCTVGDLGFPAIIFKGRKSFKHGQPVITIVIDDVGVDRKRSARAIELPAQITLAFLPYAPHVQKQVDRAIIKGHEIMVHMPMQPTRSTANPGPDFLGADQTEDELKERLAKNLSAFTGYVGINNHMGSSFTRDSAGMHTVMRDLKNRNLFFLDSKTAPDSVAEDAARKAGVPTTHRDVFLDHFEDRARVEKALAQVERIASHGGSAVAIGHPKDVTLEALEKWIPTLEKKGFRLISMQDMIALREGGQQASGTKLAADK